MESGGWLRLWVATRWGQFGVIMGFVVVKKYKRALVCSEDDKKLTEVLLQTARVGPALWIQ